MPLFFFSSKYCDIILYYIRYCTRMFVYDITGKLFSNGDEIYGFSRASIRSKTLLFCNKTR